MRLLVRWSVLLQYLSNTQPENSQCWLTPTQAVVLPISEKYNDYAQEVVKELAKEDVRAEVDDRNEKIGRKIRDNELKRIPFMLIVGEKEAEESEVSVRKQGEGDKGSMKIAKFAAFLNSEIESELSK